MKSIHSSLQTSYVVCTQTNHLTNEIHYVSSFFITKKSQAGAYSVEAIFSVKA